MEDATILFDKELQGAFKILWLVEILSWGSSMKNNFTY
jgi:hypothetical protein